MKVLVFGEILWDIIGDVPHLGGAPLNFAAHVKKFELESAIISCLGNDELGDHALEKVKELGVKTTFIQRCEQATGTVPVTLLHGQPEYEITRDVAYDYIQSDALDMESVKTYDTFYFGSLIQRSPASNQSLKAVLSQHQFDNIFYDVNLRKDCYSKEIIEYSLQHCTILKVNDDEVNVLNEMIFSESLTYDQFCERIKVQFPQIDIVIITAGKYGCLIYSDDELNTIPTKPAKVLDSVGAGDAFSAAFLSVFSRTLDPLEAAEVANRVGGFVASCKGPIPTYSEELKVQISALKAK